MLFTRHFVIALGLGLASCSFEFSLSSEPRPPAPPVPVPETATELDAAVQDVRRISLGDLHTLLAGQDRAPAPAETGKLQVQRAGAQTWEDIGVGGMVHPQDALRSDEGTLAQLEFYDGSARFVMGHGSHLTVAVREKKGSFRSRTVLRLHEGRLRLRTQRPAVQHETEVHTAAAEIVDKGTSFLVRHTPPRRVVVGGEERVLCPLCHAPLRGQFTPVGLTEVAVLMGEVAVRGTVEDKPVRLTLAGQRAYFGDLSQCPQCRLLRLGMLSDGEPRALRGRPYPPLGIGETVAQYALRTDLKPREVLSLGEGTKWVFVLVPASRFRMGSPEAERDRSKEEGPPHELEISKPFYMAEHEVTVDQFGRFVAATGYLTEAEQRGVGKAPVGDGWGDVQGISWRKPGFDQSANHPVVLVSWSDAQAFTKWAAPTAGRPLRLPTEAEWECACRAGTYTAYPWGDDPNAGQGWGNVADQQYAKRFPGLPAFGWDDGFLHTAPVGSFKPNAWGLYDMVGNVCEWCQDRWGENYYAQSPGTDPEGPSGGQERVVRGGGWGLSSLHCRCAARGHLPPESALTNLGFRVVFTVLRPYERPLLEDLPWLEKGSLVLSEPPPTPLAPPPPPLVPPTPPPPPTSP